MVLFWIFSVLLIVSNPCNGEKRPRIEFFASEISWVDLLEKDLKEIKVASSPFLNDSDILRYEWSSHRIELTPVGVKKLVSQARECYVVHDCLILVFVDGVPIFPVVFYSILSSSLIPFPGIAMIQEKVILG